MNLYHHYYIFNLNDKENDIYVWTIFKLSTLSFISYLILFRYE